MTRLALFCGVVLAITSLSAVAFGQNATPPAGTTQPGTVQPSATQVSPAGEPIVTTTTTSATPTEVMPPAEPALQDLPEVETTSPINRPLFATSFVLLGGTYVASVFDAWASSRPEDQKNLYIPVVGPWLDLGQRDCNSRPCDNEGLNKALLIADGIGQGLGALGLVSSLFIPEKTIHHWYLFGGDSLHVTPTRVGLAGYGIGAAGQF